jgi:hypothetical protein
MTAASLPTNIVAPTGERKQVMVAIIPKPDLSPADCQRLAYRLSVILKEMRGTEDCIGKSSAIDDLIAGELPKPIVMRAMAMYRELKRTFKERYMPLPMSDVTAAAKTALADHPLADLCDVPAVFLSLSRDLDEDDEAAESRVLAMLPAELLMEVRTIGPVNEHPATVRRD